MGLTTYFKLFIGLIIGKYVAKTYNDYEGDFMDIDMIQGLPEVSREYDSGMKKIIASRGKIDFCLNKKRYQCCYHNAKVM